MEEKGWQCALLSVIVVVSIDKWEMLEERKRRQRVIGISTDEI